jgi:glucan phosphoethanolaminetransferase (alkaline phosphatase superfamily)
MDYIARMPDGQLGSVVGQPVIGQIIFAVLVSFGLVAFAVKAFLNVSYIWPSIASSLVTALGITIYAKQNLLEHLVESWPATFFSNPVISILPIQMVAFGTLGAITGYWLAIRYSYWRKSEAQ